MKENIEIQPHEKQSSEGTYIINKPLKLSTVHEGEPTDNVLVYGTDKEVRSIPRSEFGGGSQDLQQTLANGGFYTDTINEGEQTIRFFDNGTSKTNSVNIISKSALDENENFTTGRLDIIQSGFALLHQEKQTNGNVMASSVTSFNTDNIVLEVSTPNEESAFNTRVEFETPINVGNVLKFPTKPTGTHILSTTDEITLQKAYETGGGRIEVNSQLFRLFEDGEDAFLVSTDSEEGGANLQISGFTSELSNSNASGRIGRVSITEGAVVLSEQGNTGTSTVEFETPLQISHFKFPAKTGGEGGSGTYTLATTDDIPVITAKGLNDILAVSMSATNKNIQLYKSDGGENTMLYLDGGNLGFSDYTTGSTMSLSNTNILYHNNSIHGNGNGLDFNRIANGFVTYSFPEKTAGAYTLATTSDLTSLSSGAISYSSVTPSALIRSERTAANYIATPGVNSTDLSFSNQPTGINGTKGTNSISMGVNNKTDGNQSITLGTTNSTNIIQEIAIGTGNSTTGGYSIAVGCLNTTNVNVSGAFGDSNIISGSSSYSSGVYAIGRDNKVIATSGGGHMIAGLYNNVTAGAWSSVFGLGNSGTTGMLSTVIGVGNNAPSFLETVIGTYATSYTPVSDSAVDLTDRLFTIGNGVDNANRSNALVMLKSGVTTLPTVTNALIKAEPTGKALITKEYLGTTGFTVNGTLIPLGGSMTFTAPTQLATTSKLTSAFSNSTTTRNTVSGWTFAVTAGKTYKIEIIGAYQTAALTTGSSIGFILTGGGTGTIMGKMDGEILQTTVNTGVRTTIRAINDINTTAGSFMTTTGVGVINSPHYIGGILNFSCITSGTFEVQFGSEVASSAAQLNAGSLLLITEY